MYKDNMNGLSVTIYLFELPPQGSESMSLSLTRKYLSGLHTTAFLQPNINAAMLPTLRWSSWILGYPTVSCFEMQDRVPNKLR